MIGLSLASLFITAIDLTGRQRLLLMWPLCLAIAVVYKTLRCEHVRQVPSSAMVLWVTIVFGLYAVGLGLWGLYTVLV